jgi:hypothetical protein
VTPGVHGNRAHQAHRRHRRRWRELGAGAEGALQKRNGAAVLQLYYIQFAKAATACIEPSSSCGNQTSSTVKQLRLKLSINTTLRALCSSRKMKKYVRSRPR